jgi:hypothetical protein
MWKLSLKKISEVKMYGNECFYCFS